MDLFKWKRGGKKLPSWSMERERSKSPEGLNATRAVSPDAALSPLAGSAWSWTGGLPVAERREAGWSDGEKLLPLLLCRVGARQCGTTGRRWAAVAAMASGRPAAGERRIAAQRAGNAGSRRAVLSVYLFSSVFFSSKCFFSPSEAKLLSF